MQKNTTQKIENKKDESSGSKENMLFIYFILFLLISTIGISCGSLLNDIYKENSHNYLKFRAEHEGRAAYIYQLEHKRLPKDLNNIAAEDGRHPDIDLNWSFDEKNNYLVLSDKASISYNNEKTDKYDFYTSLCRSIQDSESDYFERDIDVLAKPVERTIHDINENLDCISADVGFKIIYSLQPKFSNLK